MNTALANQDDEGSEEKKALELIAKGSAMEQAAMAIIIKNNEAYEAAAQFKIALKAKREEILARPLEEQAKAYSVKRFLDEIVRKVRAPFDRAESIADQKMLAYRREIEIKRQEEARKANEKAQAEAKKIRDAEIARAKELGDKEAARNLKAAPLHVEAVAPKTPEAPKISGMAARKIWKFRVDANKLDRKYMIPDEVTIGKMVRALGAKHGISGVTAWQEETI